MLILGNGTPVWEEGRSDSAETEVRRPRLKVAGMSVRLDADEEGVSEVVEG